MAMNEKKMESLQEIEIDYRGPGIYWLVGPEGDGGQIPLGPIYSEADLASAVEECVSVGTDDEVWIGWYTWREPERKAEAEE
jgi:hypothetical protein